MDYIWTLMPLIAFATVGSQLAKYKHRSGAMWGIICLLSGWIGAAILSMAKELEYEYDYDLEIETKGTDVLGITCLVLAIPYTILTFYISYSAAHSYHDDMMFNAMMNFVYR